MRRLHRRDHAELSETPHVQRRDYLRVFDPVAVGLRMRMLPEFRLEYVQRLAIARIADRVDAGLEARLHGRIVQRAVEAVAATAHPAVAGLVRVILQQTRPPRSQRAIVIGLHRSRHEHAVGIGIRPARDPAPHQGFVAQREHRIDPDRELALGLQRLESLHRAGVCPGFVHRHKAVTRHLHQPCARLALPCFQRGGRDRPIEHGAGAVEEQAIGPSVCAKPHFTALGN